MGSQLSPLPPPFVPLSSLLPLALPPALLRRPPGLGVWASNKLLLQTWA